MQVDHPCVSPLPPSPAACTPSSAPEPPPSPPHQAIEAPALAVMVPLLVRGLRESTAIQRKCCVITTNMAKLVNSPLDAAHFLPALVPGELLVGERVVLARAPKTATP